MNPKVVKVETISDYQLIVTFSNDEKKLFDMKPWLHKGVYIALQDKNLFEKAYIAWGTVVWNDDLDMSPDTLYLDGKKIIESQVI